jgi:hypothetical protein
LTEANKSDGHDEQQEDQGRVLGIPPRRGIWLHPYKDIRYYGALQWTLCLVGGIVAILFGALLLLLVFSASPHGVMDLPVILLGCAALLWGLLYAPAAIIYFLRRRRGEMTDFFDYDVVHPGKQRKQSPGEHDASDRR